MKRKTKIILICVIVLGIIIFGFGSSGDDSETKKLVDDVPTETESGFDGFEGKFVSNDGNSALWIDASGYGVLLVGNQMIEGRLVPVSYDELSFKLDDIVITFNAKKDLVAFGGFGNSVLHRDTNF